MRIPDCAGRGSVLPSSAYITPSASPRGLAHNVSGFVIHAIFGAVSIMIYSGFIARTASPSSLLNEDVIISTIHCCCTRPSPSPPSDAFCARLSLFWQTAQQCTPRPAAPGRLLTSPAHTTSQAIGIDAHTYGGAHTALFAVG